MTAINEVRHWDTNDPNAAYHAACIRDCAEKALEHQAALEQLNVADREPIDELGVLFRSALARCNKIKAETPEGS